MQLCTHHSPTDADKQLRWLATSVRPVIQRFIDAKRVGQALAVLGLDERVSIVADAIHSLTEQSQHPEIDDDAPLTE